MLKGCVKRCIGFLNLISAPKHFQEIIGTILITYYIFAVKLINHGHKLNRDKKINWNKTKNVKDKLKRD